MIKISALTYAKLIAALIPGDLTIDEIAEETGLHYLTVCHYVRALHREGVVHVARWEPDARGRHSLRNFKLGRGTDARKPKMSQAERQRRSRDRVRASQQLQVTAGSARFEQAANGRLRFVPMREAA